jgi:hypothetical protein
MNVSRRDLIATIIPVTIAQQPTPAGIVHTRGGGLVMTTAGATQQIIEASRPAPPGETMEVLNPAPRR